MPSKDNDGKDWELSDEAIDALSQQTIDLTDATSKSERKKVAKKWMQDNLLGKSVKTSDGKVVVFNSKDTVDHVAFNVMRSRSHFVAMSIPFIPQVFAKGEFVGRKQPDHDRKDESIQAFHLYRKWCKLKNGYEVFVEVQACERQGKKELFYVGYNLKTLDKIKAASPPQNQTMLDDLLETGSITAFDNDNLQFDRMQELEGFAPLRILAIKDENGELLTDYGDDEPQDENNNTDKFTGNDPTTAPPSPYPLHKAPAKRQIIKPSTCRTHRNRRLNPWRLIRRRTSHPCQIYR